MAGWVVVEAAFGAALGIAAGPHAHVHGVDGLLVLCPGERVTGEQAAQGLGVYSPMPQRGVEAAPSATMGRLETQVDRRRYGVCAEESVGELEEGVGPAVETRVERVAERAKGVKSVESFHDATIMHSPAASRTFRPPAGLKRKLSCLFAKEHGYAGCLIHEILGTGIYRFAPTLMEAQPISGWFVSGVDQGNDRDVYSAFAGRPLRSVTAAHQIPGNSLQRRRLKPVFLTRFRQNCVQLTQKQTPMSFYRASRLTKRSMRRGAHLPISGHNSSGTRYMSATRWSTRGG